MKRIVIVGGGVSGLTLAYRLEQRLPAVEVVVLEQQPRLGGKVATFCRDGFRVEAGPNGFLDTNPATLDLCRELGLGDRLTPASDAAGRNRFLFLNGRLRMLPGGLWSFLTSDVLSWRGKLNLWTERFQPPRRDNADESIDAFVRRRAGREVAETLADAFVTGIHAGDPMLLSVRAAFPRLAAMEREHGSVAKGFAAARRQRRAGAAGRGGRMWSFREGLGLLTETLRGRLRTPPLVGVTVRSVRARSPRRLAHSSRGPRCLDGGRRGADLPRAPAGGAAGRRGRRVGGPDRRHRLQQRGGGCAGLSGRGRADVPGRLRLPVAAAGAARRAGRAVVLVNLPRPFAARDGVAAPLCGGWNRPDIVDWDDDRLLTAMRGELGQAMGVRAAPVFHEIVRWTKAIPQYHLGHLERVGWIEERTARHPGLYLGGNAYRGVALNDCVEQAATLAERMASCARTA